MADYIELSMITDCDYGSQVEDVFTACGAFSVTIQGSEAELYIEGDTARFPQWKTQNISALFPGDCHATGVLEAVRFSLEGVPGSKLIRVNNIADRNWAQTCLENYRPVRVGDRLCVSPTWCQPNCENDLILWIDPGRAFGTGSHESTHLCLQYMHDLNLTDKSVVDYGCGSGILGLAACRLGAGHSVGVDVDPCAVDIANENARLNGVEDKFRAMSEAEFTSHCEESSPADVLVANILAATLIELSAEITQLVSKGGLLMLAGILQFQGPEVIAVYQNAFILEKFSSGDWLLLTGKKRQDSL